MGKADAQIADGGNVLRVSEGEMIPVLRLEVNIEDGSDLRFEIVHAINKGEDVFRKLSALFKAIAQPLFGASEKNSDRRVAIGE